MNILPTTVVHMCGPSPWPSLCNTVEVHLRVKAAKDNEYDCDVMKLLKMVLKTYDFSHV